jgi:hypothetical protein
MSMTREEAHKLVDELFDNVAGTDNDGPIEPSVEPEVLDLGQAKVVKKNGKVVRTKSSGDRVYHLDDDKGTRRWITNPQVLEGLGFTLDDVTDIEDAELLKYQMGPALYRVESDE